MRKMPLEVTIDDSLADEAVINEFKNVCCGVTIKVLTDAETSHEDEWILT